MQAICQLVHLDIMSSCQNCKQPGSWVFWGLDYTCKKWSLSLCSWGRGGGWRRRGQWRSWWWTAPSSQTPPKVMWLMTSAVLVGMLHFARVASSSSNNSSRSRCVHWHLGCDWGFMPTMLCTEGRRVDVQYNHAEGSGEILRKKCFIYFNKVVLCIPNN